MSNCPHEAWDFGALQCPDCSAVKDHVTDAEYAKLAAEAQALREEVAALRITRDDFKLERDLARKNFCDEQAANYQLQAHLKACLGELSELRARVVVVPERKLLNAGVPGLNRNSGWNACLDELARLNGKTVSEALLRQLLDSDGIDGIFDAQQNYAAHQELRALLNQDKENGNG